MTRTKNGTLLLAMVVLLICTGTLQATVTLAAPSVATMSVACDTVLGAGPSQPVGIKLASGSTALAVGVTAVSGSTTLPNGGGLVLPGSTSVTSSSTFTTFNFAANPGCKGASFGVNTFTLTFTPPSPGSAVTVAVTLTVTANGSSSANATALAPSPSAVKLTCTKTGSTYSAQSSQVVNVVSAAPGGTPFTVNTTALDPNAVPAWLSVLPTSGGTANIGGVNLTFTTAASCGNLPVGTTTGNVHLLNAPAPDKVIPVTVQVGTGSTLTATPSTVNINYVKGDTYSNDAQSVVVSSSAAAFYSVDATTLPLWLNVSAGTSGTPAPPSTTVTLTFVPTAGAQTLSPGTYSAGVHLKVSGQLDTVVTVTMQLSNAAPSLTVAGGSSARTVNWVFGGPLPTVVITPVSSDSPIPFSVTTTAGTLSPQVSITQGLAYSFGTPISVTFLQSVFATFTPGMTAPTGTVTIHYGTNSHIDIVLNLNILAPTANIASISPSTVATASSGSFPVALTGTGFQSSTTVGIVSNGLIIPDTNIATTVVNSTTIVLTISVPGSADPLLPLAAPGSITIGVCNPGSGTCTVPTGTAVLHIGVNPIIQAVTSASSYMQVAPPALQQVAPYDILSVFGTNFCVSNASGCISPNPAILYGQTDPVTLRYLTSISPDAQGATQRNVTVGFYQHNTAATLIASAPLLFATNGQINLIAPGALATYIGSPVDIVVSFGYGPSGGANLLQSAPFTVVVASADPGVFSTNGDGQGQAAALGNSTGALITQAGPAIARNGASDSDIIQLYVTGLGVPDSDGVATEAYPGNTVTCMSAPGFFAAVNSATSSSLTTDDGLVLQHSLFPSGGIEPCLRVASAPSVTIGNVAAPVLFAGWVADSVAGLYQIDVQLPTTNANTFTDVTGTTAALGGTAANLPIVVTMPSGGPSSQPTGVSVWAMRGLKMATTGTTLVNGVITLAGSHTAAVSGLAVVATEGTATYTYSVLSGTLPTGLTLNADGTITGTPGAGQVTVVFQAQDSAGTPLTGTISINFNIS